jgi:hypothetical protein
VYGMGGFVALAMPAHTTICVLSLQFISVEQLRSLHFAAVLQRLPALASLSLAHNRLTTTVELQQLLGGRAASSERPLRELSIHDNPICGLALFRPLVLKLFLVRRSISIHAPPRPASVVPHHANPSVGR